MNELTTPQETSQLAVGIVPESVLLEAKARAIALRGAVDQSSKKPLEFNGNKYLYYEHLQILGTFYGVAVRTGDAVPVEIDGIKGAKATAVVVDRNGREVGGAESYCLRDEKNWEGKPWFQLASMAQTRAGAKALRNLLAWVTVLAGYDPTPADELDGSEAPAKPPIKPPEAKKPAGLSKEFFIREVLDRKGKGPAKIVSDSGEQFGVFSESDEKLARQALAQSKKVRAFYTTHEKFGNTTTGLEFVNPQ